MRGNVIDLAVGVVIGAAFGKIVTSLVNDVIMPPIGNLIGGIDFSAYKFVLTPAANKKPHPQVYLQMLDAMQLPASHCLAFEDSSNGLRAATAAGLATIVTPNPFTAHHDFRTALKVLPDLGRADLNRLRQWHAARYN